MESWMKIDVPICSMDNFIRLLKNEQFVKDFILEETQYSEVEIDLLRRMVEYLKLSYQVKYKGESPFVHDFSDDHRKELL